MPGFGLIKPLHPLHILAIVLNVSGVGKLSQVGGALTLWAAVNIVARQVDRSAPRTRREHPPRIPRHLRRRAARLGRLSRVPGVACHTTAPSPLAAP